MAQRIVLTNGGGTETEPRWLSNLEKVFEFSFKLSFILVAILDSLSYGCFCLAGLCYLTKDLTLIWNGVRSIIPSSLIVSVLTWLGGEEDY